MLLLVGRPAFFQTHGIKILASLAIIAVLWLVFWDGDGDRFGEGFAFGGPARTPPAAFASSSLDPHQFCAVHRLRPFVPSPDPGTPARKVYDLLLVSSELETLEMRLAQMYDQVDWFVVLEADRTFTNEPKPLYVAEAWARFRPYHAKMIRHTLNVTHMLAQANASIAAGVAAAAAALDAGSGPGPASGPVSGANRYGHAHGSTWDIETRSRDAMFSDVVPFLAGDRAAHEGDVLLVSDVDEVPKPQTLAVLRACEIPARTGLGSQLYYYSFQWLSREDWAHPQATTYRGEKNTILPHDLRLDGNGFRIKNAAWHCSYCFDEIALLVNKVSSFSHQELNRDEFKDPRKILQKVRYGLDLFGRDAIVFDFVERNCDIPEVVKRNPDKYRYMLDRTPSHGNFVDLGRYFAPGITEKG